MDRLEFTAGLEETPVDKARQQADIDRDVAEFLAKGGVVEKIDYNPVEEICARVGRWNQLGERSLELEEETEEFLPYS